MQLLNDAVQDVAHAGRALRHTPGFTTIVIATLGLGIGANAAIFSVADAVLLRDLPYDHPERIAYLWQSFDAKDTRRVNASVPELRDYEQRTRSLEAVGGIVISGAALGDSTGPERVQMALVTRRFFDVFRVPPVVGRVFTADEALVPFAVYALISHRLWQRRFGGDRTIVGRAVLIGGRSVTIVGVMPDRFAFPAGVDVWRPLINAGEIVNDRSRRFIDVIVRVKPGLTVAAASREVDAAEQRAPDHAVAETRLVGLRDELVGPVRTALLVLLGTVALVLLIACANVANLLLARAAGRQREMSIRTALGASRSRLVRQLLTESLVLALGGAVAGLLLARIAMRALLVLAADRIPRASEISLDWRVLAVTLGVSVVAGLLFGSAPALTGWRVDAARALGNRGDSGGVRARKLRSALVVTELALSLVLVVAATLLGKSFVRLRSVELGFREDHLLTLRIALPYALYPEASQRVRFFAELLRRTREIPGVTAAGASSLLPVSDANSSSTTIAEGGHRSPEGRWPEANVRSITPGYLEALGVPLLRGRLLDDRDGSSDSAGKTALINASLARTLWPASVALGKRFSINAPEERPDWRTVVGVVGDFRQASLDAPPRIEMYESHRQNADATMSIAIRTRAAPASFIPAMRRMVRSLDPTVPAFDVRTMEQRLGESMATRRFHVLLSGIFSVLALVLAAVGLYGVIAYAVAQRTVEIGVRVALGASQGDVLWLVVRHGLVLAGAGIALGAVAALATTRVLSSLLYGVDQTDPTSYVVTACGLLVVGVVASWIPARRALVIEPVLALRYE